MTQDQINETTDLLVLEARAEELSATLADSDTDPNLYHAASKELEAVNLRAANVKYDEFFALLDS